MSYFIGRRNWDSEPALNGLGKRRKKTEGSSLSEKSVSKVSLCSSMGEKEKSRAMQNVESKLMKAIKEVNESDISENNTPLNRYVYYGISQFFKHFLAKANSIIDIFQELKYKISEKS